jgi:hypothetical protein
MVFLRDLPGDYIVEYKTLSLLKAIKTFNSERSSEPISCIIGSAFYGKGGKSFAELYDFAEKSIIASKNAETNSLSFFPAEEGKKTASF